MTRYFNVNKVYFNGFTNDSVKNIVNSVNFNNVYFINNTAGNIFENAPNLTSVTNIHNTTTNLSGAFYNCYNISTIPTIPNTVTDLSNTFMYCYNITNVTFAENSSVTNMANAFYNCINLQEAVIPNNVTNLCRAFRNCTTITYAPTIPDSVTNMVDAFHYCANLTSVNNISNNADNLYLTFSGTGITDMPIIPNSVTNMYSTFHKCYNLVNVTEIPESVEVMDFTFSQCNNLTGDIYIKSEEVKSAGYCFNSTELEKNIYIPYNYTEDSKIKYKLNAKIYGDLVQEGCKFSNFSKNNYLKTILNKIQNPTKLEIAVCVNISDFNTIQSIFMSTTGIKTSIQENTGKIGQYSSSGWVWSTNVLDLNRDIWIKDVFENGECKVYHIYGNYTIETLPTNIESWTLDLTATRGIATTSFVNLGYDSDNVSIDEYLHGTLYLDKAYIKADDILVWKGTTPVAINSIEGTKIIGTLTNSNDIYSDFTESDYLHPDFIVPRTTNNWEIIVKAQNGSTQATDNKGQQILVVGKDITISEASARILLLTNAAGNVNYSKVFTLDETQTAGASWTWTADAELWYKFKSDGNSTYIYSSTDGITWILKSSVNNTPTTLEEGCEIYLGRCPTAAKGPWKGNIDINECYMIVDGKVIWNGVKRPYPKSNDIHGTIIGSLNNINNIISNFSANNYFTPEITNFTTANPWEIDLKVITSNDVSTRGQLFQYKKGLTTETRFGINIQISDSHFQFDISYTGTAYDIDGNTATGTYTILPNTTYWIRQGWTGTEYYLEYSTDGINYSKDISIQSSTPALNGLEYPIIGCYVRQPWSSNTHSFSGKIDLSYCYIKVNNELIWEGASYSKTNTYTSFRNTYPLQVNGNVYGTGLINNDGIVSEFSTANALFIPVTLNSTNFIMYTKFRTSNIDSSKRIIVSGYNYTLYMYYGSSLAWWSNPSGTYSTLYTLSANTTYWLKMVHNGTTHTLYISVDGTNYTQLKQWSSQYSGTGNQSYQLGSESWSGSASEHPFNGTIDLNEFRITDLSGNLICKGTYDIFTDNYRKVNLNENITGSILNKNGVVNNFSESNYLTLQTVFNPSTNPWELVMKINTPTVSKREQYIFGSTSSGFLRMDIEIDKACLFLSTTHTAWDIGQIFGTTTLNANTWYWIKAEFTGTVYNLYTSIDGINYTLEGSITSSTPVVTSSDNTTIGHGNTNYGSAYYFEGSIDLNGCYLKINNTLWWKGTTYLNNGVLFKDINDIPVINVEGYEYLLDGTESVTLTRYIGEGGAITIPNV